MTRLNLIATVARNTFTESIRQPIYLVILMLTLSLIAGSPAFSSYTFDDDDKLLENVNLNTIFLAGLLLAAFTATRVLTQEIQKKTVLSVVSKPIGRPTFIIGKYTGVLASIWLAHWIWSLTFLLATNHGALMTVRDPYHLPVLTFGFGSLATSVLVAVIGNYVRGWVFSSTLALWLAATLTLTILPAHLFGPNWERVPLAIDPQLLLALLFAAQALAVLSAIAIAASTRCGSMLTFALCLVVFFLGLTSEYIFGTARDHSMFARIGHVLSPNLQYLWLGEALLQGRPVDAHYVLLISAYCVMFVAATLGIAVALFQTRDVG